jgi:MinD superfamily P-loop ATPase
MKEIVIISGKGGTGKTSVAASFAMLVKKEAVIADCDVDAADMHLLLEPDFAQSDDFYSGTMAVIYQNKCTKCGKCETVCRFDAINVISDKYEVNKLNCEGCGYCARICPEGAIENIDRNVGTWHISTIKTGAMMVHAKLGIGADNSGKLVAHVKDIAKKIAFDADKEYVIIDGSPGIGCPVIASISGVNFVLIVTEPTMSGLHDLQRVYELVKKFKIPTGCIINKSDLNNKVTKQISKYLEVENIAHIASIPYDDTFTTSMMNGKTIIESKNTILKNMVMESWEKIQSTFN